MRRHEYAAGAAYTPQEQLLFQRQFLRAQQQQLPAANIKRIRQPIYQRRYSYESEPENVVPIYSKFIYPTQQQPLLMGLNESMSSLASGEYDYSDFIYEEDVRAMPAYVVEEPPLAASKVVHNLNALGRLLELLQRWPLPRLSFNTACICVLIAIFIAPRTCAQSLLFPAFRLFFGTLYPAYASYKAVRTKNVKEYVKWMMYWIVFAFFTCIETFTDIFLSWFPLYYEVKVVIVLWLLSPVTKGSSTLYRKFVHPMLTRREQEIDEYLNQARERGYSAVLQLGSKGVNYATNVIMQTAIKGGGNLVQTIKRSYSLSDLSEQDVQHTPDELDAVMLSSTRPQQRLLRPRNPTAVGRSASGTRHSTGMYFTEVDVTSSKNAGDFNFNIRSTDDISSGYSSAEPISAPLGSGLSRTSSMTNASKARAKSKRSEQLAEAQLLEDMRAEVYLENERYFQSLREGQQPQQEVAAPTMQSNKISHEHEGDDEEEEDFYEALPLEDDIGYVEVDHGVELSQIQMQQCLPIDVEPQSDTQIEVSSEVKESSEMVSQKKTEVTNANKYGNPEQPIECVKPNQIDLDTNTPAAADFHNSVDTDSYNSFSEDASLGTPRPMSPRELRATLEEIKHSFRAQLEPETSLSENKNPELRPKAQHGKGRAPAPPLPPRPAARTPQLDNLSLTSNLSTTSERGKSPTPSAKSGISNLFKNIKANVLRSKSNTAEQ